MKVKNKFFQTLLIGLILILVGCVIACDSKAQARQQIVDYINTMMPVMGAHADWYDAQNRIFQQSDPDYSKFLVELRDLLDKMEKIYMDVQTSMPPKEMREFKGGWSRECELCILAVGKLLQAVDEGNVDLVFEAQELMFEANNVKNETTEKLLDLLEQYNIDISDLSSN